MKKDIFYLLNQVETDLGEYEISELTQEEAEESMGRILRKLGRKGMHNETAARIAGRRKVIKAAVILAVCLLSAGGITYAMTDGQLFDYVFISGGGIYEETESSLFGEKSTVSIVGSVDIDNEPGVPLLFEEGRLYFTGDGGKTDITDEISETEPCVFNVVDDMGNTHKFIIGGRAEKDYYGYDEELYDSEGVYRGGVGSYGYMINFTLDNLPEWLEKEKYKPMP